MFDTGYFRDSSGTWKDQDGNNPLPALVTTLNNHWLNCKPIEAEEDGFELISFDIDITGNGICNYRYQGCHLQKRFLISS